MKFKFPIKGHKPDNLMRECGYTKIFNRYTQEESYVRRPGRSLYPRFHVYLDVHEKFFNVNLHLDQKKASYEGTSAHAGEYDGETVKNEALRITAVIAGIYGVKI